MSNNPILHTVDAALQQGVRLIRGSDIEIEIVQWLWPGWLAKGKLNLLAGVAGTGKTTLAIRMAAATTTGGPWPGGPWTEPADVVMWSGEDGIRDVLMPRFLVCGGDRDRLHFVDGVVDGLRCRPFDPATDMPGLAQVAGRLGNLGLLIVDPLVSAVRGDSHKNAEVRQSLQPLVDLGRDLGCALLGITHFSKNTARLSPLDRVTGSLAFGALARVVLATSGAPTADRPGRIVRAKSNLGPAGDGYEYQLVRAPVLGQEHIEAQRVEWLDFIAGRPEVLLGAAERVADEGGPADGRGQQAIAFLWRQLQAGPVAAVEMYRRADEVGIAKVTLDRMKNSIGVKSKKIGSLWFWFPPGPVGNPTSSSQAQDSHSGSMSTLILNEDLECADSDVVVV